MKFGTIVFARMNSSRLPGKAFVDLGGRPLIGRVLDRACLLEDLGPVIVATSDQAEDDSIADFAISEGIGVYRGDLLDVASRAYHCAMSYELTHFARVCGDRPFLDPGLISDYWDLMKNTTADLVTNVPSRTFPPGLATEVICTKSLKKMLDATDDSLDREHVTQYFYRYPHLFQLITMQSSLDWTNVYLAIDNSKDVERARYIIDHLGQSPETVELERIAGFAKEWQALQNR